MNDRVVSLVMDVSSRFNPSFPETPLRIDISRMAGSLVFLDPRRVKPLEGQPRKKFKGIERLAFGIEKAGQKTPILVCPVDHPDYDAELIEGERRTRACVSGGMMIRAEVRPRYETKQEHFADSFVANFDREGLTSLETVQGVAKLVEDGYSLQDIAEITGMTVSWASQYSSLSKLHPDVLALLDEEGGDQRDASGRKLRRKTVIPPSVALHLTKLEHDEQLSVVQEIMSRGLSVGKIGTFIRRHLKETGRPLRRRNRTAHAFVGQLERTAGRFSDALDQYLDMKSIELQSIIMGYDRKKLLEVAGKLREVSGYLDGLANNLSPKGVTRK